MSFLHPRDLPIRQKILLIGLLPGCVGLLLACAIFVVSEKSDFTDAYTERLGVLAEIVAKNVAPQLAVRDRDAAEQQLESLRSDPHLLSAVVHDAEGNLFAGAALREGELPGADESRKSLTLYHPIVVDNTKIGTVQVRASMELLDQKVVRYAWVTLVVLVLSGGIALLIAMRLRRWISTPVLHLTARMREIAEGAGDLTRRIEIDQQDEVGQLAYWFNTFLAAQRDRVALIAGNARLLGASSDQMATISEQMSSNAEETSAQASVVNTASERVSGNLQRVAAAAEQLHGGSREIAAHVTDSVAVADKAVREAAQTSDTLARLSDSGDEIGAVVKVINSIAEQTNLLALNATIAAAASASSRTRSRSSRAAPQTPPRTSRAASRPFRTTRAPASMRSSESARSSTTSAASRRRSRSRWRSRRSRPTRSAKTSSRRPAATPTSRARSAASPRRRA